MTTDTEVQLSKHPRIPRKLLIVAGVFSLLAIVTVIISSYYLSCGGFCGSVSTKPNVRVPAVACTDADGTCTLFITNTGNAEAVVVDCSFTISDVSEPGILSPATSILSAPGSQTVVCIYPAGHGGGFGTQVQGTIIMIDGSNVRWEGIWE